MPESLPPKTLELRRTTEALCLTVGGIVENSELDGSTKREQVIKAAKEAGIYLLTQPPDLGGYGATNLDLVVVHDVLGIHNLCHVGGIFAPNPGVLAGVEEPLRSQYLKPLLEGTKSAAFGFTEPTDATSPTSGVLADGKLTITGRKSYVTGGASADFVNTLVEIDEHGPAMVVIDRDAEGVTIERIFGSIDGSHHAVIKFDNVKVPASHVIGEPGRGMPRAMTQIGNTRLVLASQSIGLANWVLEFVTKHLMAPHRSGEPLAKKEGVRLRYADMRIKAFAARSTVYRTARVADSGENAINEVIASKVIATEMIDELVDTGIQLVGGRALQDGHPLSELSRRVRAWRLAEGPSDILRLNLARGKLDLGKGRI